MKEEKSKRNDPLSAKDELVLNQTKPYITVSILCCLLTVFCLAFIGFQIREKHFGSAS